MTLGMNKSLRCPRCKQILPLSDFHPSRAENRGSRYCRSCSREYSRNLYQRDKLKGQVTRRASYQRNKMQTIARRHGLTREQYQRMIQLQRDKCAICGKPESHKYKGKVVWLAVDHNHKTGKVRQLLCRSCNLMLGLVEENLSVLRKAISYLKKHTDATEGP